MIRARRSAALAALVLIFSAPALRAAEPRAIALTGGTIVDVSDFGNSTHDIPDAVVLMRGGRIVASGRRSDVPIPGDADVVDVHGKYLLPGLIDGFAGLNSQAQANAYLYMGVTSIVGMSDGRRGELLLDAHPSPRIYPLDTAGIAEKDGKAVALPEGEALADLEAASKRGVKVLLVYYPIPPPLARSLVARAKELGMATIGELGVTPYPAAIECGVQAFVHTSRYSLQLAPDALHAEVAADPFGPPKAKFYDLLSKLSADDPALARYAAVLGGARVGLMPTMSLGYLDLPGHANPWKEPVAAILDPNGIHLPADPATGERSRDERFAANYFPSGLQPALLRLEERYRRGGAKYLAGSGTSAFGTMPGISLHTELGLLHRIGLAPRQALAAATGNFRELFQWTDVGSLSAGVRADVLVLDGSPVEDLGNLKAIARLYLAGEAVDRAGLLRPKR
ncbi:MAG TPA: hypothetical protein VE404_03950 [Verrucomicrobiae bacterium]|nr:hypothetical protein [Verrucomicrobiae bacterium]